MDNVSIHDIVKNAFRAGLEEGRREKDPKGDLISLRQAYAIFGKGWMEQHLADGAFTAHRTSDKPGARYRLSYAEIQAVQANESICEIVIKNHYKKLLKHGN